MIASPAGFKSENENGKDRVVAHTSTLSIEDHRLSSKASSHNQGSFDLGVSTFPSIHIQHIEFFCGQVWPLYHLLSQESFHNIRYYSSSLGISFSPHLCWPFRLLHLDPIRGQRLLALLRTCSCLLHFWNRFPKPLLKLLVGQ